jgi:hypothetical protein
MVDQRIRDEITRLGFEVEATGQTESAETVCFTNKNGSHFALSQYKGQVSMTGAQKDAGFGVSMDIRNSFSKDESLDDVGRAILTLGTLVDW